MSFNIATFYFRRVHLLVMYRLACEDLDMLTDERYKRLMEDVGMPNSRSLLQALKQAVMEATIKERNSCAALCDSISCDQTKREGAETCAAKIRAR